MRYVAVLVLLAGCDDTIFGPSGGGSTTPSIDGYAGVQEMVQNSCVACHGTTTNAVGLNLDLETDLHTATVGVVGAYGLVLVAPNDPPNSLLYTKLTGDNPPNSGTPMPLGNSVGDATIKVVEDWILAGAPAQ